MNVLSTCETEKVGTCGAEAICGAGISHRCRYDEGHDGPHQSLHMLRQGWRVGIDWYRTKDNGHALGTWVAS